MLEAAPLDYPLFKGNVKNDLFVYFSENMGMLSDCTQFLNERFKIDDEIVRISNISGLAIIFLEETYNLNSDEIKKEILNRINDDLKSVIDGKTLVDFVLILNSAIGDAFFLY